MEFLKNYGFTDDEIYDLKPDIPNILVSSLVSQSKLVGANIEYLKSLGVTNYKEVFIKFYEVFLLDYSEFKSIFEKYDKDDLIKYLENNIDVLEYL